MTRHKPALSGETKSTATFKQLRRLRTWCGHPLGMNTASPSFCVNDHGLTPVSSRAVRVRAHLAVQRTRLAAHVDVTRCPRGRDSLSTQVRDNAIGALARMLQGVPGAIPVGDILALVVDHFPLQVRVIS